MVYTNGQCAAPVKKIIFEDNQKRIP